MRRSLAYLCTLPLIAIALVITGCNNDDNDSDGGTGGGTATGTVTGTWTGNATADVQGQIITAPTTFRLTQSGTAVTGTWDGESVTGTFDGVNLALTIPSFVDSGITFTGTLNGTLTGGVINFTGTLTGSLGGTSITAVFSGAVTRTGSQLDVPTGELLSTLVDTMVR